MPKTKSKEYIESESGSEDMSSAEDSPPVAKKTKKVAPAKKGKKEPPKKASPKKANGNNVETASGGNGETLYPLSKSRNIGVSEFRGTKMVNIREYYEKDGKALPGKKGISLTKEQWENLKSVISKIDAEMED